MRNKYLLLAASTAMMLAACSDDITQGGNNNGGEAARSENSLNLKALSGSQNSRVKTYGVTRGVKADRLQRVAEIAPIENSDAANYYWSATSVAIKKNGTAYVTWHSNHQAATAATRWGGALDVINVPTAENAEFTIAKTFTNVNMPGTPPEERSQVVKFNSVIVDADTLYIAGTSDRNGAVVSRLVTGTETTNQTISIPGSSANSMALVDNTHLVAVSGYHGGAFKFPVSNFKAKTPVDVTDADAITTENVNKDNYGGKYVTDGYILRTDAQRAYIVDVNTGVATALDVPLTSSEKYGESFNASTGEWEVEEGATARYYGKHTMTVLGDYIYVAAGKNGLRVYDKNKLSDGKAVWSNKNGTNAVVAFKGTDGNDYIAAATEVGLRIYRPYGVEVTRAEGDEGEDAGDAGESVGDGSGSTETPEEGAEATEAKKLTLYAFEVDKYKTDGTADSSTAHANGHSPNFVAVDETNGYIYVAYGQTGVNVYKLNFKAAADNVTVSISIPSISHKESKDIPADSDGYEFTIPDGTPDDVPEGMEFLGWATREDASDVEYVAGDKIIVKPGDPEVVLYPVWVKEFAHIIKFDGNKKEGVKVDNLPEIVKIYDDKPVKIEDITPTTDDTINSTFIGWATDKNKTSTDRDAGLWKPIMPGDEFTPEAKEVTLYAIWATDAEANGDQGSTDKEEEKTEGGSDDVNSGKM